MCIRDRRQQLPNPRQRPRNDEELKREHRRPQPREKARKAIERLADESRAEHRFDCLLYTSDAADERSSVDLGGRRIIKKKKKKKQHD